MAEVIEVTTDLPPGIETEPSPSTADDDDLDSYQTAPYPEGDSIDPGDDAVEKPDTEPGVSIQ